MSAKGNIYDEFEWRGLLYDATPGLKDLLAKESVTAYIGFDPTAASLHVGSLLPIMGLARLQRFGHTPIALVGGGTGLIGDPSGKTAERQLLNKEKVEENIAGIKAQLSHFLDFEREGNPARIENNHDWLGQLQLIDFLRDTGKHFTVNYMLSKESVKRRIESEDGISYTEFTYMMLQAYDFLELNRRGDCSLQMGGSDQWGNILAGTDLIRRVNGNKAHGLVFPLVTNASGTKFGKSEAGNVWLDPELTSPYKFYQFWMNTDDRDVIHYLKSFTWLSREEIDGLEAEVNERPGAREAQRTLARHITTALHGESELAKSEMASKVLFGGSMENLGVKDLRDIFEDVPSIMLAKEALEGEGMGMLDVCSQAEITSSNGEARRLIRQGGLFLNGERIEDENARMTIDQAIEGELFVLRKGKKSYHLVQIGG
ncbi:MAG: tyrosine--tRNA ligase [Bacteroidetes bacterium]|nr:tyrosine--tRNA ligase [Bacteroidota bacterium]